MVSRIYSTFCYARSLTLICNALKSYITLSRVKAALFQRFHDEEAKCGSMLTFLRKPGIHTYF